MSVPARVSIVTLGVRDLPGAYAFYEALGWTGHRDGDDFARFETGGAVLTLYDLDALSAEAASPMPADGFGGITVAVNVERKEMVDEAIAAALDAGGRVLAEAVDRPWGGRSGYFADPEGHVWEVAWMPGAAFDDRGGFVWP